MMRLATRLALMIAALAALFAPLDARADTTIYRHFRISNPLDRTLNYQVSWDNGSSWKDWSSGTRTDTVHWSTDEGVTPKIRFDADLTDGTAWRTYALRLTRSNYQPTTRTDTQVYEFVVVGGSLLDLKRER